VTSGDAREHRLGRGTVDIAGGDRLEHEKVIMDCNRRAFIRRMGTAGLISTSGIAPAVWSRAAAAAPRQGTAAADRILVLIQLAGGNDGLNTVVPFADDAYYRARPGIGISESSLLKLNDTLGLHPQMVGFKELYDEGRLSVVQGVGYANPDRSHFRSMDIWQSARLTVDGSMDGWLGRALDQGIDQHVGTVPAMSLGTGRLPLSLVGHKVTVPTIRDLNTYRLQLGPRPAANQGLFRSTIGGYVAEPDAGDRQLEFLRQATDAALTTADSIQKISQEYRETVPYPASDLGGKLKLVAQLISGDLGTRIFFVSLGGFDTHAQQQQSHLALLNELSSAVRAFYRDLKGHGHSDRVVLATFSEFGRRVAENGSLGTDHGAASQLFVVTPGQQAGIHGRHPSLTQLIQGDLRHHTDFRSVYATLLERWLDIPSQPVLGQQFPLLDFI